MDWMLEILSWPVEWTALHGIAEIKTPLMRVSTQTDATPDKYVVQRLSQAYPQEGALGAAFPFKRMPAKERLSRSRREVVKQPRQPASREEHPWLAADNGFASSANMETAHQPIIALALEALAGRPGCVLDLGCGNGALLKKIQEGNPSLEIYGLDWEDIRIEHARQLMPGLADHFAAGNMFSSEWPWQAQRRYLLAILMPGRFLEVNAESRQFLRTCLQQYCDQLLVYAYDDWLQQYGGLGKLAQAAGFELPETRSEARVSLARCV
jgi:SAM-dependent methyltransferase